MNNTVTQKILDANNVFNRYFIEGKNFYLHTFNVFPNINYIGEIDGEKVFEAITETLAVNIRDVYQRRWFKRKAKHFVFDTTIVVLEGAIMLEITDDYLYLFHNGTNSDLIECIVNLVTKYKKRERKAPLEINLIMRGSNGLDLKPIEIKKTKLDLELFYNDDFKLTDSIIQSRLKKNNDKGIVLLHGLPGTGKTTYLRYLVGRIKKRVLFLSPSVAGNLMDPDFIELLVSNPNTVLVIEDAENIIMDRRFNSSSSVSNLLNISDGLMADFLNVQIICTFNSALTMIDSALMRKGRLIARYEFGKLSVDKARHLNEYLGQDILIDEPMTLAEITHPNDKSESFASRTEITGFRRRNENK